MKRFLAIFLGIVVALLAIVAFKIHDFYTTINTADRTKIARPTVNPQKTSYNILLLGEGGPGHEGADLTDTMMVAHLDLKTRKVFLISLPRDLWVEIPTKTGENFHGKINSVYEMGLYATDYPNVARKEVGDQGAAELVKQVVGDVTGLPIDNYVTVDFNGFKQIIDTLGGVDVNVETTFDDYEYPIDGKEKDLCGKDDQFKQIEPFLTLPPTSTDEAKVDFFKDKPDLEKFYDDITNDPATAFPCRYEHVHFDKGVQHMDGTSALKYARSRHSLQDGTDFGRASRQQRVLEAVKNKVLRIDFLPKLLPFLDQAKKYLKTDIDIQEVQKLLLEAKKSPPFSVVKLVPEHGSQLKDGVGPSGEYTLISTDGPDEWGNIQSWIQMNLAGITPTPTPGPTTSVSLKPTRKPLPTAP